MAHSFSMMPVHLVFGTKERRPLLIPEVEAEMFAICGNLMKAHRCHLLAANGVADHVHLLFRLSRTACLGDVVEDVKKRTSFWLKTQADSLRAFAWQQGYAAFSVDSDGVEAVAHYIAGQKQRHRTQPFEDEYRDLLRQNGIDFDERYLWE